MPPPDLEPSARDRAAAEPGEPDFPDDISRAENETVATTFASDTGRQVSRAALGFAIVFAIGAAGVGAMHFLHARRLAAAAEAGSAIAPSVNVVVASAPAAGKELTLPGETAAWFESTIYARVSGYVGSWSADIGDRVKQGQVLAVIETPELDAELAASRAQLKASEAQVTARESEVEFARSTNERWRDSPKGVVSDQERESKRADFETASARLYAARAQVALDAAKVRQYEALAHFKSVTAPFDGVITERRIDVGNLVTSGSTSATSPLYRICRNDPLRVFVDVPQGLAAELHRPDVQATVSSADGAGASATGKVARAANAFNTQSRTMRVEVDIPNQDGHWFPGMYTRVSFSLAPRGGVEIPAAALLFRADGPHVARVDTDGRVQFVPVNIARDDGNTVEITSAVRPGDRLVLNIPSQISAGEAVTVTRDSAGPVPPAGSRREGH